MQYVIEVLAAILIGVAIGSVLGPRQQIRYVGALVAIALGLVALFTAGWIWLAAGAILFLAAMCLPAGTVSTRA